MLVVMQASWWSGRTPTLACCIVELRSSSSTRHICRYNRLPVAARCRPCCAVCMGNHVRPDLLFVQRCHHRSGCTAITPLCGVDRHPQGCTTVLEQQRVVQKRLMVVVPDARGLRRPPTTSTVIVYVINIGISHCSVDRHLSVSLVCEVNGVLGTAQCTAG
jgi:hypothetical protein